MDDDLVVSGQEPSAKGPGSGDDEPTVETSASGRDDEPTMEIAGGDERREVRAGTSQATGRRTRLEVMTAARRERRRRAVGRLWVASVPVLVLLAAAVVLLALYGGQADDGPTVSGADEVSRSATAGSAVLLVEDGGSLSSAVVLQPWDSGGLVLEVPGITLLETQGEFQTLADTYEDGGQEAVTAALAKAFDLPMGPSATIDAVDLWTVVSPAGGEAPSEREPASAEYEAGALAQAIRGLVGAYSAEGGAAAWDALGLSGDETAEFLEAVGSDAVSMVENVWTVSVLTGTVVEGDGFRYLEPDVEAARELLIVDAEDERVYVEIRDGGGVEGAARAAGGLLEESGFVLAPMGYAEGYPAVETTQILASADTVEDARRVLAALGVGQVVQEEGLDTNLIVVILGKDFDVTAPTTTSEPIG